MPMNASFMSHMIAEVCSVRSEYGFIVANIAYHSRFVHKWAAIFTLLLPETKMFPHGGGCALTRVGLSTSVLLNVAVKLQKLEDSLHTVTPGEWL